MSAALTTTLGISPPAERNAEIFALLQPVFEEHDVPAEDRLFLYAAFDALIEDDLDNATVTESIERGRLGEDAYEDLLQSYDRGHRRNRPWFRSGAYEPAVPTRRGRALLRALAAVNPDWKDGRMRNGYQPSSGPFPPLPTTGSGVKSSRCEPVDIAALEAARDAILKAADMLLEHAPALAHLYLARHHLVEPEDDIQVGVPVYLALYDAQKPVTIRSRRAKAAFASMIEHATHLAGEREREQAFVEVMRDFASATGSTCSRTALGAMHED